MLPLIQSEIEYHGWLTTEQFLDILAIAEITPGPLAVNAATYIGYQTAGFFGSLLATVALALPSLLGMILLTALWQKHQKHPLMESIMRVLRPVVIGLIMTAAAKLTFAMLVLAPGTYAKAMIILLAAGGFSLTRFTKLHPALVMLAGALAGILFFRQPL